MIKSTSIDDFYREIAGAAGKDIYTFLPPDITKEIGHFNIFDIAATFRESKRTQLMPYNKRMYYKISLIRGRNLAEYADKTFDINGNALLFATPKIPYHWLPQDDEQSGFFCVFTEDFLHKSKGGLSPEDMPIFQPGAYPIFHLDDTQCNDILQLFQKMDRELHSDYMYKYDLIRHYVMELIHYGQKLHPVAETHYSTNAATRVTTLFAELLERQFPIEHTDQRLMLRTAKDFAERLAVHVNHLNKVLKETTGQTTTNIIGSRVVQEAKLLLKHTNWSISEIAYSLGFEEIAHFSNFSKKRLDKSKNKQNGEVRSNTVVYETRG